MSPFLFFRWPVARRLGQRQLILPGFRGENRLSPRNVFFPLKGFPPVVYFSADVSFSVSDLARSKARRRGENLR